MSPIKLSFLLIVFLTYNVAIFVRGQVNAELDRPFVTREGAAYRDKLTIETSKSVAKFAKKYQRAENGKATHNRRKAKLSSRGSLQKVTFTTFGKGYDPNSHAAAFDERFPVIDFTTSRRLHYLSKHKKERTKADRDEFNLIQESKKKERTEPQPRARIQTRPSASRSRPAPIPNRQSVSRSRPAPRRRPASRQRSRIPAQRPLPSASQRARSQVSTPRRSRPQSSSRSRAQPSVPARTKSLPRQRTPINRFQPFTTPRPTPRPQVHSLFNAQHAANIAQPSAPVVTSRIIIPAAEYYQTISPNYQYDSSLPIGSPALEQSFSALPSLPYTDYSPAPIPSVPALPYSEYSTPDQPAAPVQSVPFTDYSAADQYGHIFGATPVNYGFSIDHI